MRGFDASARASKPCETDARPKANAIATTITPAITCLIAPRSGFIPGSLTGTMSFMRLRERNTRRPPQRRSVSLGTVRLLSSPPYKVCFSSTSKSARPRAKRYLEALQHLILSEQRVDSRVTYFVRAGPFVTVAEPDVPCFQLACQHRSVGLGRERHAAAE